MGNNCKFGDVKCLLKGTPLGPVAKALDKPWQVATSVASVALKGTPLEQTASAFNQASHGDVKGSIAKQVGGIVDIAKAAVPGLGEVPGIGIATDFAKSLVDGAVNPKKAGGAATAVNVQLPSPAQIANMVGPNSPLGRILTPANPVSQPVPPRVANTPDPREVQAIVAANGSVSNAKGATPVSTVGGRFKPKPARAFTRAEWIAHVNDPRSVGGTQPWNTP